MPKTSDKDSPFLAKMRIAGGLMTLAVFLALAFLPGGENNWALRYLLGRAPAAEEPIPFETAFFAIREGDAVVKRTDTYFVPGESFTLWFEDVGPLQPGEDGEVSLRTQLELRTDGALEQSTEPPPLLTPASGSTIVDVALSARLPESARVGQHQVVVMLEDLHSGKTLVHRRAVFVRAEDRRELRVMGPAPPPATGCSVRQLPQDQP